MTYEDIDGYMAALADLYRDAHPMFADFADGAVTFTDLSEPNAIQARGEMNAAICRVRTNSANFAPPCWPDIDMLDFERLLDKASGLTG